MASAMAALAAAAAAAVRPGERRRRRHDCWGWDCAPARTFQKTALLNENKQGRISQRRRITGCEVTTWRFIFWQPTSSQQVILLMGWIPVHGSIICFFYECFTNSHAPHQYIDVFAPWFELIRSARDTQSMSVSWIYCIDGVMQCDSRGFRERKGWERN